MNIWPRRKYSIKAPLKLRLVSQFISVLSEKLCWNMFNKDEEEINSSCASDQRTVARNQSPFKKKQQLIFPLMLVWLSSLPADSQPVKPSAGSPTFPPAKLPPLETSSPSIISWPVTLSPPALLRFSRWEVHLSSACVVGDVICQNLLTLSTKGSSKDQTLHPLLSILN